MNPSRPDVVFDCNIFVQAISRTNGPAAEALRLIDRNIITLHLSKPIVRELRRTLAYPEIRRKNPHVTPDGVEAFLEHLLFRCELARDVARKFEYPRDPADEPYLNLCAAVRADFLVTRDQDLLAIAGDPSVEAKQIRQRLPRLAILNPVSFLDRTRRLRIDD